MWPKKIREVWWRSSLPGQVQPPSEMTCPFIPCAASAHSRTALNCGYPTPVCRRVVQTDPGPIPTLIMSAPAKSSLRFGREGMFDWAHQGKKCYMYLDGKTCCCPTSSTISPVTTFPATIVISGKASLVLVRRKAQVSPKLGGYL